MNQEYKNIHQQNIEILSDDKPYIIHELLDGKHVFYSDTSACITNYDKFYWIVDGSLLYKKEILIEGSGHEIKYVSWNESEPEKVVGVIKKYD